MKTIIKRVTDENFCQVIEEAALVIKKGGTVAFPTETVYGLGANALDEHAVKKIFVAKGRPQDNPLIIHVADKAIESYVMGIPPIAKRLMEAFWPGPLTIIFNKSAIVPDVTSANLQTIGIRMPNHPIALALIQASGVPIAAPSANRSGKPSPTTLEHCVRDLEGRVDYILGGPVTEVGLESTIVDCTVDPPVVLRPGSITLEQLRLFDPRIDLVQQPLKENEPPKSPGMKYRHYAPNAPLQLIQDDDGMVDTIRMLCDKYTAEGKRVGILATEETKGYYPHSAFIYTLGSRKNLAEVGQKLYDGLRKMDEEGVDIILSETFPETGLGIAIMNRLKKAMTKK